jgi:hypothetical protein
LPQYDLFKVGYDRFPVICYYNDDDATIKHAANTLLLNKSRTSAG